MRIESYCTKTKMVIENLTEEILAVAVLRETEIENQHEADR